MQKREFLKRLKRELQWHVDKHELRAILSEYEGYFAAAASSGTDEAAAAAELGDPALVATEVLSERHGGIAEVRYNKQRIIAAVAILAISTVLYALTPTYYQIIYPNDDGSYFSLTMAFRVFNLLLLLPTTLALLLGFGRTDRSERGNTGWLFGANIVTSAVIWVFWYSIFYLPLLTLTYPPEHSTIPWFFGDIAPSAIGPLYSVMLKLLSLVAVAFIVTAGRRVVCHRLVYIPLFYLNCATLCGFYEFGVLLMSMSDPATLPAAMGEILVHIGLGVLISAAVALLLHLRRRRASE